MKLTMKYISFLSTALLMLAFHSCSEDTLISEPSVEGEGTLLNLYIGDIVPTGTTRLAELGGTGNISGGERPTNDPNLTDKKNIGLNIVSGGGMYGFDGIARLVRTIMTPVILSIPTSAIWSVKWREVR